jgi:ribonuclease Z
MAKLIILGASASQTALHETTSFVVDTGDCKILIDAGPGVVRQLYRAGFSTTEIDLVIITHCHGDHTLGFPYFIWANSAEKLQGKNRVGIIPIIALPEVYKGILDMYTICYPSGKPSFSIENWEASFETQSKFNFKDVSVTTTPVNHAVPTIGVRLDFGSTKIMFSSDTIYDIRVVELAKGCQVLIHEAMMTEDMEAMASRTKHSMASEAGKAARDASVESLIMCHILSQYFEKEELLINEARKYFKGKIIIPKELEEIEL